MKADRLKPELRSVAMFPCQRRAVSALFLANGFTVGNWAPKIPEFAARLGLSESGIGLMILVFGIGSLVAMPVVGALIARLGSQIVVRVTAVPTTFVILAISVAPNIPLAAVVMLVSGAAIGGMDVAMNANAVVVERSMKRSIMSSCHGFWSLGGLVGAAFGGLAIAKFGILGHAVVTTTIAAALVAYAWSKIHSDKVLASRKHENMRFPTIPLPYLIGLIALFSMIPEGAALDWSALYLRQDFGADVAMSGLAFAALSATMAVVRFAGDPVRDYLGAILTLRICAISGCLGFLIAGFAQSEAVAIIGFGLAGIGIANMVPIAFSAAGNLPGLAPGIGISVVTAMGYSGILLAPSAIGLIAESTGFAPIFAALPLMFLVVLALSGLARYADG